MRQAVDDVAGIEPERMQHDADQDDSRISRNARRAAARRGSG